MFDFDGVISNSLNVAYLVWKQVSEEFDTKVKIKDVEHYKKMAKCNVIHMLESLGLSEKEYKREKEIWAEYRKKYPLKPFDGIENVLNQLSQKYTLALVSGASKEAIETQLKEYNLLNLFKVIIPLIYPDKNKPNPYHLNLAIEKLGVDPKEIVYIGDMVDDIQAARKAGLEKTIGVSYGFGLLESIKSENPTFIVNSPNEILDAVSKL